MRCSTDSRPRASRSGSSSGRSRRSGGAPRTPFPKGAANWRKIETRTPEALAITQLKGLKLLLWCVLLHFAHRGYRWAAFHSLGILSISDAFRAVAKDAPLSVGASWASILCSFFERLFELTVFGHTIVACCRMAGFAALRNTYRPFEARNVADFWNGDHDYFKELLVEFFYYPTFLRYFKRYRACGGSSRSSPPFSSATSTSTSSATTTGSRRSVSWPRFDRWMSTRFSA